MDIKLYAAILLIARLISMGFVLAVILRQVGLFKVPIENESQMTLPQRKRLRHYRVTLFVLALSIFIGNLVPATIDILTIFADLDRTASTVKPISVVYTMTWATTMLLSSFLIWRLYYLSRELDEETQVTKHSLLKETEEQDGI